MNPKQQFIDSTTGVGGGNPFADFLASIFHYKPYTVHYNVDKTVGGNNGDTKQKFAKSVLSSFTSSAKEPEPTPADYQYPSSLGVVQNDPGSQYDDLINQSAGQYKVPPAILKALLAHESAQFQPKYVGGYHTDGSGRGIAAIDKNAHPEIADEDAFNPKFAVPWAAKTLSSYYGQEKGWNNTLRRYNGGPNYESTAPGYEGVPVNKRTQDYATNVYKQSLHYAGLDHE